MSYWVLHVAVGVNVLYGDHSHHQLKIAFGLERALTAFC
jgi:hypothetical protein